MAATRRQTAADAGRWRHALACSCGAKPRACARLSGPVPLMALTATATRRVEEDVKRLLGMPAARVFRGPVTRRNLEYRVEAKPDAAKAAVAAMADVIRAHAGQSGIVYCLTRKEAEDVAAALAELGLRALPYHAELGEEYRRRVQEQWQRGVVHVMVATVAFGMGIDKPDVRFVLHHSLSKSLAAYYQESGRAGRDGERALCVVYYRAADVSRQAALCHRDRAGPQGILEMARYCHSASCRRRHMALHLGDSDPGPCPPSGPSTPQCDRCAVRSSARKPPGELGDLDLSCAARTALEAAERAGGKATVAKLADMCRSSSSGLEKSWGRAEWEGVVVHLLGAGFLTLNFRQTRYATNAYVNPAKSGPAAAAAQDLILGKSRLVADIQLRL